MSSSLPAGWYADPADDDHYRYWSGTRWTTHVRPRREVDDTAPATERALPDFDRDDRPATPRQPPERDRGRRRVPVLLVLLSLAVLVAVAGVTTDLVTSHPEGDALSGEIRVDLSAVSGRVDAEGLLVNDAPCGRRGGRGIGAGTEVALLNGQGDVLARTELGAGRVHSTLTALTCVFPYSLEAVADARTYIVRVQGEDRRRVRRAEVEAAGWRVDLRIR